jgi:hypothetical protein
MSPTNLSFEKSEICQLCLENCLLRSDICLQRIDSVVGSTGIFSLLKRCFAIISGKKARQCWVQKFFEKLLKLSICTDGEAAVS